MVPLKVVLSFIFKDKQGRSSRVLAACPGGVLRPKVQVSAR